MHGRMIIFTLLALLSFDAGAQTADRPEWSIRASIGSVDLIGEWELSTLLENSTSEEVLDGAAVSQVGVEMGSSFQLSVKLVSPSGQVSDITGSSKLMYRPKACMTVAANGVATVVPDANALWACEKGDPIPLTIIYADPSSKIATMNVYLLRAD